MIAGDSKEVHITLATLIKTLKRKSAVIEGSSGNTRTESTAAVSRWTGYCSGLYNYDIHPARRLKAYLC